MNHWIKRCVRNALSALGFALVRKRTAQYASETSKCRQRLAPYCAGYGVDLGFGGDPINESAIRIDLPLPYADTGSYPTQLAGSADKLQWFRDGVLDYVYSSHLLEDFENTEQVLNEWLRVLRPGGRLVIYCPDESKYRAHCANSGQSYNYAHKHADFSLAMVKRILANIESVRVIHEDPLIDVYSWELVAEKTA